MLMRPTYRRQDIVTQDGRRNQSALFSVAHRRARQAIADGSPLTYAQEFATELRILIAEQNAVFNSHPANRGKVRMTTITTFATRRERAAGVTFSKF